MQESAGKERISVVIKIKCFLYLTELIWEAPLEPPLYLQTWPCGPSISTNIETLRVHWHCLGVFIGGTFIHWFSHQQSCVAIINNSRTLNAWVQHLSGPWPCTKQVWFDSHFLMATILKCFFLSLHLRSVEDEERPFALGMQFVLLRTLGMFLHFQVCLLAPLCRWHILPAL